jgi:hypothetical protein
MNNEFSKIIEHDGDKIEVYTYKNEKDICFFIEKDRCEKSESYFYLDLEKAKDLMEAINSAIIHIRKKEE